MMGLFAHRKDSKADGQMAVLQNFIGGAAVPSASSETFEIVNPATGEAYATSPNSNAEDVDKAMAAASAAFAEWKKTTPSERMAALLKIADAMESAKEALADAECKNCGKPRQLFLDEELTVMCDQIRFFAGAARNLEGKSAGEYMKGMFSIIVREPIGVCAQVTPWNYPIMMAVWKWAPAIAAGNCVVLKPSETTPVATLVMAKIMNEILPPGVFNVVCGAKETGALLVQHPTPAMCSITGSIRAGKEVAAAAAPNLKRTHLELGGKAPVVVFADADLKKAAADIAVAGSFNAGQDCTAATRVIVEASAYEEFVKLLAEQAAETKLATAKTLDEEGVLVGPLNNKAQFERVSGMLSRVPAHAKVVCGGKPVNGPGFFVPPTVISDLKQEDELIQEEIFGPVITVQLFEDEAEAIAMANGVKYGLASSVWTKTHEVAMRCSLAFDFGCVWINTHIPLVAEMPHGGFKQSGYGKDLSGYGFEDYTRIKHVMTAL
jgi:betaine-aldehyde dehydrogenase